MDYKKSDTMKKVALELILDHFEKMDIADEKRKNREYTGQGYASVQGRYKNNLLKLLCNLRLRTKRKFESNAKTGIMRPNGSSE